MGKGKLDRTLSNRIRRKRKRNKLKLFKHLMKHPNYYNQENQMPWRNFCVMFNFYMLLILIYGGEDEQDINNR